MSHQRLSHNVAKVSMAQQRLSMESNSDDTSQCDGGYHNLTFASYQTGNGSLTMRDMAPEATSSRRPSDDNSQVLAEEESTDAAAYLRANVASEALQRLNRHACEHAPQSWPALNSGSGAVSSGGKGTAAPFLLGPEFRLDDVGIGQAGRQWRQQGPHTEFGDSRSSTRRSLSADDVRRDDGTIWADITQAQVETSKPDEAVCPLSPGRQQLCNFCSHGGAGHEHQHTSQRPGHPSCASQACFQVPVLPTGNQGTVPLATQRRQQHWGGSGPLVGRSATLTGWPRSHSGTAPMAGQVVQPLQQKRGSGGLDGWPCSTVDPAMVIGSSRHATAWPQGTGPAPAELYSDSSAERSGSLSALSQSSRCALWSGVSREPSEPCSSDAVSNEAERPSMPAERLAVLSSALPQGPPSGRWLQQQAVAQFVLPSISGGLHGSPRIPQQAALPPLPTNQADQELVSYPIAELDSLLHSTGSGMPASQSAPGSFLHRTDSGRHGMQSLIASLAGLGYDTVSSSALMQIRRAVSSLPRPPILQDQGASHISRAHSAGDTTLAGQVQDFGGMQEAAPRHWSPTAPSTVRFPHSSPGSFNNHTISSRLVQRHPQSLVAGHSSVGQAHQQQAAPVHGGAWEGQVAFLDYGSQSAFAEEDFLLRDDAPHVAYSMLDDLNLDARGQRAPWHARKPYASMGPHATADALATGNATQVTRGQPAQPRWGSGLLLLGMCVVLLAYMIAMVK